ncbi:MAG TPA: mechanosensitive ion channel family protein [Pyrinomonadaceae bacterium]|jgi:small-conductance mechanosensitive channel|nr:mechanosensitive ion channel family protein [Pyrinomonadaceae bacterium]
MTRKRFIGQFVFPLIALAFFALALHFLPSFAPPTVGEAELSALSDAQRKAYWRGHTTYDLIDTCLRIARAVSVMLLAVRLAGVFFFDLVFRVRKRREAPHFVRDIFALVAYVVLTALILKLSFPTLSLGALLSGSALLGIIVGLALQDTLGNLFAGVSLQADKPFDVGDVITVGAWTGVVESVTWRAVKVRTFTNRVVLVSNSSLAKESIEVSPRDNLNARIVFFNAVYTDSPAKVIHVVREAVRDAENVSQKVTPVVRVRNLGDFAVDYEIKYWLDDYAKYNDTDALVRQLIWYAFRRARLTFAYPTQTLYVERPARDGGRNEAPLDRVAERLSAVDIFAPLSAEEVSRLAAGAESHTYAPGESIIRAGEAGDSMFVVNRGTVEVRISAHGGKVRTVATLDEGDFFGEMALFTGEPRTANVVATQETEVLEIGHQALKRLFESNPDLVESLSHTIEERRAGLTATAARQSLGDEPVSLLTSIKRFFGMD